MANEVTLTYVGRYKDSGGVEVYRDGVTYLLDEKGCVTVPADVADGLLQQEGEWQKTAAAKTSVKESSDG